MKKPIPERNVSRIVAWLFYVAILGCFGGAISAEPHNADEATGWLILTAISAAAGIWIGVYQDAPSPRPLAGSLLTVAVGLSTLLFAIYYARQSAMFYFMFPGAAILTLISLLAGKE